MASDPAFKQFRREEQQAFLEWRRTDVRYQQERLKALAEVDVPAWKKRRLMREIVSNSKCLNYEEDVSNTASCGFLKVSIARSSPTAGTCSCADDSTIEPASTASDSTAAQSPDDLTTSRTTGRTDSLSAGPISEEVDDVFTPSPTAELVETSTKLVDESSLEKLTISRTSDLVDELSSKESDYVTVDEMTVSEQNSPERTRRSEDFVSKIRNLSPTISAQKISLEAAEEPEAEQAIGDFAKASKVQFFKAGRLYPKPLYKLAYSLIYTCLIEEELTSVPLDRSEENSNASTMLLVPDNVQPEVQQLVREFVKIFNYRVMVCDALKGSYDERITHVLFDLDTPDNLTFAQYQAIGCRRYLISANWLQDSLEQRRILPEEPYELIFLDEFEDRVVARPSRSARLSYEKLFERFAILLAGPFDDFEESQMVRLLINNGAEVCDDPRQLINLGNKARICIIDPRYYRNINKDLLKKRSAKYKFVAVHFLWIFDTFRMYRVQPLLKYLCFAKPDQILKSRIPWKLLK